MLKTEVKHRRYFSALLYLLFSQIIRHRVDHYCFSSVKPTGMNQHSSYYEILGFFFPCQSLRGMSMLPHFDYSITSLKELQMKHSSLLKRKTALLGRETIKFQSCVIIMCLMKAEISLKIW